MFTTDERAKLRAELIDAARADDRVAACAITGSVARAAEDRWSDIDLSFGLAEGVDRSVVIADWTGRLQSKGCVDTLDVPHCASIYRVFLLNSGLQVDIAFTPIAEFRALAPTFQLVFGDAAEARHAPPPTAERLIGYAWLYALHVRSSLARGRLWQAEMMVSAMRDQLLSLACVRHKLPAHHGKGFDELPAEYLASLNGALVRSLERAEIARAFGVVVDSLLAEVRAHDALLAERLERPLDEMARTCHEIARNVTTDEETSDECSE